MEYIKDEAQPTTTQYYNIQEQESDEEPSDTESEEEDTEEKLNTWLNENKRKRTRRTKNKQRAFNREGGKNEN